MKCCICEKKEFAVMIEAHLPPELLPNIVCDDCLIKIEIQCGASRIGNAVHYAIVNKKIREKGKRCK